VSEVIYINTRYRSPANATLGNKDWLKVNGPGIQGLCPIEWVGFDAACRRLKLISDLIGIEWGSNEEIPYGVMWLVHLKMLEERHYTPTVKFYRARNLYEKRY
jgi:hypothetical protein